MKTIEVLLREHVKTLGRCGEVVRVKAGYARNYLLPQRIAVQATDENKKMMARRAVRLDAEEAKLNEQVDATIASLTGLRLETKSRADDHGHLYGSVSAANVVELLKAKGHEFAEKAVRMDHPIKSVGEHEVAIHIHDDKNATVTVAVEAE